MFHKEFLLCCAEAIMYHMAWQ